MGYEIFEKLCKEKGITPYKVAQATKVSTATLSSWKTGRYQPKTDKLQAIADFFDVPLVYILTGEDAFSQPVPHTGEEYGKIETILNLYGWSVSKSDEGVVLSDNGISYTVSDNSYERFCEDTLQYLENEVHKLLHDKIVMVTLHPTTIEISPDKIKSIASALNKDTVPIAAHASQGTTTEDIQEDIALVEQHKKGDLSE